MNKIDSILNLSKVILIQVRYEEKLSNKWFEERVVKNFWGKKTVYPAGFYDIYDFFKPYTNFKNNIVREKELFYVPYIYVYTIDKNYHKIYFSDNAEMDKYLQEIEEKVIDKNFIFLEK